MSGDGWVDDQLFKPSKSIPLQRKKKVSKSTHVFATHPYLIITLQSSVLDLEVMAADFQESFGSSISFQVPNLLLEHHLIIS
jgi:hypothetical protein